MQVRSLVLAAAAALCATSAHAIKINDQAFVTNGGDLANIPGTAPNVFDTLRTASLSTQFQSVGRLGNCTATWLGTEGDYAWVLTAARCVQNTNLVQAADSLVFTTHDGVALAGGAGSTSYIHPKRINRPTSVRDAGTDIAMVRLKRLPASDTQAPESPVLYVGTAEAGTRMSLVGYGNAIAHNKGVDSVWPTTGARRVWGESVVDRVNEDGHALVAGYTPGSTTHWAGIGVSDAGSAWWQQRNGTWEIVATSSSGTSLQSNGARVSKYAPWIKGMFPGLKLAADVGSVDVNLTDTQPFVATATGAAPTTAYLVAPGQAGVVGPTSSYYPGAVLYSEPATLVQVPVTDARTGRTSIVGLRGSKTAECGSHVFAMNNRMGCSGGTSVLTLAYSPADSGLLSSGQWRGSVVIAAHNDPNKTWTVNIDIARGASVTREQSNSIAMGSGVYFTVPAQTAATGPTSGHLNVATGHSFITVQARDAVTQTLVPIKLRAQRNNGCTSHAMNNANTCAGQDKSELKVWFDPADNASLAVGRYQGEFGVQMRNWYDKAFQATTLVDYDINLLP